MSPQTVIISGASRCLVAVTARIVARLGANVVLFARSTDALAALAQEIQIRDGQILTVVGDVRHLEDCQKVVAQAMESFGDIDALINNAGIVEPVASVAQANLRDWETNIATNLLGPVALTQAAIPYLRRSGGRVINVSSGAAVNIIPGIAAYSVAKAALNHFTRLLAVEESLITAISVQVGAVNTNMQEIIRREGAKGMPEQIYAHFIRLHQDRQLISPELPGQALALIALYAPHEWSGSVILWNDSRVQMLSSREG